MESSSRKTVTSIVTGLREKSRKGIVGGLGKFIEKWTRSSKCRLAPRHQPEGRRSGLTTHLRWLIWTGMPSVKSFTKESKAWSRTQQTVSLSSAEAELYAVTTGVAEGMVTKHILQELGHEVILMNDVNSQSAKAWASKRGLGRMKRVMLKYMYVQDVVDKKLTNLAYINMKQNEADLMTKCHTSEAHKRGCAMIGSRLA